MNLNFKSYNFNIKREQGNALIFDIIRKKYVALTPEEWVRQHIIWFLAEEKGCPKGLIAVEKSLTYNGLSKRFDICVANNTGQLVLLVECKAPSVKITQAVVHQAGIYQKSLGIRYILLSNGFDHLVMKLDSSSGQFGLIPELPHFAELT